MQQVFLINGYGVPKSILKDENYLLYLKLAFNRIFTQAAGQSALIILSGGPTDMWPPYRRTEAAEMGKLFRQLMMRPMVRPQTKRWKVMLENRSLSTLENILFVKKKLPRRLRPLAITIFGEVTRKKRMEILARRVFAGAGDICVAALDFDQSPARYQDLDLINKKEILQIKHDLLALKSPTALRHHHQFFVDKLAFFRSYGPTQTQKAIRDWWQMQTNSPLNDKNRRPKR